MDATPTAMNPSRYRLAPSIRVTFTNEGATALDTADGRIIAVNPTAAALLRELQGTADVQTLRQVLATLPDAPPADVIHAELRAFLSGAVAARLVREVTP